MTNGTARVWTLNPMNMLLTVSLRVRHDTTQVMLGVSLRATWDTTLVMLIHVCKVAISKNDVFKTTKIEYNYHEM